jgi:hypothetical protein
VELAMSFAANDPRDGFEISVRFRQMIEKRIFCLEKDAAQDEFLVLRLENSDHVRRQLRLVAAQRSEAERMRRFLDNSRIRVPRPMISL